jgi:predicted negative regulator of RcsB-dependent stress response
MPSAWPGTEKVAQLRPRDSARSPSARAGEAASAIAGNKTLAIRVQATKPLNCATSPIAVADKDDKKDTDDAGQPGFDPKPVQLGGESIVDRLMPYRKKILIAVLLGFAVWGAIAVVFYIRNNKRAKNTTKLAQVLEVAQRDVRPAGEEPDPKTADQTFATSKERAEAVLGELENRGAEVSPTYRASLLMQAGRVDDAIAEYRKAQTGRALDNVLAREGLGLALEAKAQQAQDAAARQQGLEEALAVFKTMQPDDNGPRRAYALYHEGRILGLLGKTAEARAVLEQAKAKDTGGALDELIEQRLASLDA